MDGYILSAEEQAKVIRRSYNRTRAYVQSEIEKILHHVGGEDSLAYEYRMKRLSSLLQNTEKRIKELYGITVEDTTSFLKSIIPEAYYHTIFDIAQGTGIEPSFAAVNEKLITAIVEEPWSGKNYSKRIWANTDKLSNELREVLTTAAMSGESISKTLRKVADSFNTSSYNAERLIRTETTYACNQAEIASYNELDIDRYKYVATLDTRTSPICQQLDGKIFETEKARAGLNLPAMHPNCRSTTSPYFEDFEPTERAARDGDGKPIRVPASMTYPEWYDKYVKPQEGQNAPKTPSKPPKGNNTIPRPEPRKTPVRTPERAPAEIDIPAPNVGEPEYRDTAIPKRSDSYGKLTERLNKSNIEEVPIKPLEKPLTEQQIITKLCGGDMTEGSCASLSFAYAANKGGVDVVDFRGGESQKFFSQNINLKEIGKLNGVISETTKNTNDFKAINSLLKNTEYNKEYILLTGKHAAVIRRVEGKGFEYLEMQKSEGNGFEKLTTDVLKKRFGCKKSHSIYGTKLEASTSLIDRESLSNSNEFKELMKYINTPVNAQKKGASGFAK